MLQWSILNLIQTKIGKMKINDLFDCACKKIAALILALTLFLQLDVSAQKSLREPTPLDLGFQGSYHFVKSSSLTPIEKIMRKADFCQIDEDFMIIPNCASELDEDGETPIDEVSIEKVKYLLERNVIKYYELKDEYNTPLKIKRFKGSENYKYLESGMDNDRECFINHTYYAIFDISSQYDLSSASFRIKLATSFNGYTFIANNIALSTNDKHFEESNFVTSKIEEDLAYQIETNRTELVVFVKFTGDIEKDELLICKPQKVYITNKNTGKIYYEYTPQNDVRTLTSVDDTNKTKETVIEYAEIMPKFPGGNNALGKFLSSNMRYPKKAQEDGVQGRVVVSFDVDVDGKTINPQIKKRLSRECDLEAIRLVEMMPKWEPGTQGGKPVKVRYTMPITFRLQ